MNIRYKPWIGKDYENRNLYSRKLMILGESHYGENDPNDENLTIRCIEHFEMESGGNIRFYRMVPPAVMMKNNVDELSVLERQAFWNSVLFYNYIQEYVNDSAGGVRTKDQWKNSEDAFYDVINENEPELIIGFGITLGNNMPMRNATKVNINGLLIIKYYLSSGKEALFVNVHHPAGGMSYVEVRNTLETLLEKKSALTNVVADSAVVL